MTDVLTATDATRIRRNGLALLPAPIIAFAVLAAVVWPPALIPILIGAGGWLLALVLRQPVALLASKRLSNEGTANLVGWFSGPAEELVRLALVLLTVSTVQHAAWFGFGWATIEVLVVFANVLAIASLVSKDDEKSREARELLAAQGMAQPQSPAWGLLERLSATAMHIGFTLLLFASPWFILLTLPLHSVTNMLAAKYAKRSIVLVEVALAVLGALGLAGGILAAVFLR